MRDGIWRCPFAPPSHFSHRQDDPVKVGVTGPCALGATTWAPLSMALDYPFEEWRPEKGAAETVAPATFTKPFVVRIGIGNATMHAGINTGGGEGPPLPSCAPHS